MTRISVAQAQAELVEVLRRVERGEDIVIEEGGRLLARLIPVLTEPRRPGRLKGKVRMKPDFDDPLPDELLRKFEGDE